MQALKLTVEPVPATTAGKSLSRLLPKHQWDKIRKHTYSEYDYTCAICGVDPKHAPAKVYPKHAPKLTDALLIETYGERIEQFRREPPRRGPSKVRLECHEVWDYDDAMRVQRLSELVALCTRCHQVKHWNWASTGRSFREGRLIKGGPWRGVWTDEQKFALHRAYNPHHYFLEDHFMWVNNCDLKRLVEHVEEAADLCYRRSLREWNVEFGHFAT